MEEDRPGREMIERAEDLILRLRDIHSCRISTDETGAVSEVHVVATTERSPKMIARDVETCLRAELNLKIDYRKIGVVIIDPMKETDPAKRRIGRAGEVAAPGGDDTDWIVDERLAEIPDASGGPADRSEAVEAEGWEARIAGIPRGRMPQEGARPVDARAASGEPEEQREGGARPVRGSAVLEFLEEDMRVRFAGLRLSIEETRVDVEVKLVKNGLEVIGCLGGYRTSGPMYETIAGAAIHALTELLDERFHLCLSTVKEVDVSGSKALIAVIDVIDGRAVRSFAGCAFVGRDSNEAAVLAVLDALNRPSGRWKSRTEIHYRIR